MDWGEGAYLLTEQLCLAPMAIKKINILGAVLELPAKQHCKFSSFGPIFEVNGWIGSAI
jgi:hypothetical protein